MSNTLICDAKNDDALKYMVEIELKEKNGKTDDAFLKIRETLSRIGIPIKKGDEKTLYQTCHILRKGPKYYITHFKLLFALDGRDNTMTIKDQQRMNLIANLMNQWDLCDLVSELGDVAGMDSIKIVKYADKDEWLLKPKYNIGSTKG